MTATRPPRLPPPPPGPPECRNSTDPICGEFRWDPPPAPNQPLVASFTTAPTTAVVGQQVTFEVSWSDGDARLVHADFSAVGHTLVIACAPPLPRYGPWTPPERVPSGGTLRFTHTYTEAGTYRAVAWLYTGDECGSSPYRDFKKVDTTIVVTAPQRG